MTLTLASNWWAVALRGLCGIIIAVIAFARPGIALTALVILFGVYALLDGVFALVSAVRAGREHARWGTLALYGVIGIAAGIVAFARPLLTLVALVALVGAWAILTGVLEIAAAFRLRRTIRGEWMMGLAGVVSVLFGAALFAAPIGASAVALAWLIGGYMLFAGVVQLSLAFRLRRWIGRAEVTLDQLRAA